MLVLGIDTSTKVGGLGLYDGERGFVGESNLALEQTHSERLMPMMQQLLQVCGITIQEVDGIAVTVGPGSFTGVRIGVTTAKTLAQVGEKPVAGVSTLEVVARNMLQVEGLVVPVFDARNRRVYTAQFLGNGRTLERLSEDKSGTIDELVEEWSGFRGNIYFLGDAVELYQDFLQERFNERAIFPPKSFWVPRGGTVAEIGEDILRRGGEGNLYTLVPNYLKPPEAEVNWQKKHGK